MSRNENDDNYIDYPENRGGSNGRTSTQTGTKRSDIIPIIIMVIIITLYENYSKWKLSITNYLLQLAHHPKQIFQFETFVYFFIIFLIFIFLLKLIKRIVF